MNDKLGPFRLAPWFSPRPWGRRDLRPWYGAEAFAGTDEPVGEAWLTGPASVVETGAFAVGALAIGTRGGSACPPPGPAPLTCI